MYQCCPAEGFFTAVGTEDWEAGYSCGTCAELQYGGNTVTVNVVDRQGTGPDTRTSDARARVQVRRVLQGLVRPGRPRVARPHQQHAARTRVRGEVTLGHVSPQVWVVL